ncbi:MAG: LPS export ABC transporter ATP-binding protein [Planctomycetaceae bacterium]|nr:LPS export ABC transporter ATP-binding protein [Planctomycetaceae bacterium]
MVILKVQNLEKRYAGRAVVDGVSFHVNQGEIVGLLGPNGAGKTTSFRMTIGMITPEAGTVVFEGHDVTAQPMYKRARLGMGYLSQEPSVFQRLTVEQNLRAILETRPMSRDQQQQMAYDLIEQFGLIQQRDQYAQTLSGGERRKLEIARSLITEPSLILLDEPFSGVDPKAVQQLQSEIQRLRDRQNIAILVTDHNVQRTLEVCDRAYIIDAGKVLAEGEPRDLINDDIVKRVYLGDMFRGDEFD